MTYGEQFDSAMKCTTKEEASEWLATEIARCVREHSQTPEEARRVILVNLGYMAGYYDRSFSAKVRDLFGALHPVFGDLAANPPTAEQAFEAGKQWATKPRLGR